MRAGGYDLKAEGFDTGAGGYDVRLPTDLTGKASFLSSIRLFCMRPAFTRLLRMHPASGHLPAQFFRIICITVLLLTALRVMPEGLTLLHAQEVWRAASSMSRKSSDETLACLKRRMVRRAFRASRMVIFKSFCET